MEVSQKLTALGAAFAFTLSGCTVDIAGWLESHPSTHISADATEQNSAETVRKLLSGNAPIHIIDVPISNAKTAKELGVGGDAEGERFVRDLHNPNGKFRGSLVKAFAKTTLGRYKPRVVNYTKTEPLELNGGCMDIWTPDALDPLREFIEKAEKPDRLNIAVVEAHTCEPPEGQQGASGFLMPEGLPVVTKIEREEAANAAVHEVGHYAGNPHAGIAECEDVTHIQGCTVDDTADYWSLMSYNHGKKFTVPELYKMGLLRPDEVVDLRNSSVGGQEVTLTDMSHEKGIKLIIGKTASGGELYLSWTKDVTAGSRDRCVRTKTQLETPKEAAQDDVLWGFDYTDPDSKKIKYYWCYEIDKTKQNHSLQMRVEARSVNEGTEAAYKGDSFVLVVPTAERVKGTKDEYINKYRSFMDPPQTVYAPGTMPIAYISADHDKAVVRVG